MTNGNDLGKILRQRRLMIPLTLRELAAASGVSTAHLARIERGERFPSARVLQKITKPLGFEEEKLLTLAGYLSAQASTTESETGTGTAGLDPYVASVLASEPVAVQRTVIGIFSILKSIARRTDCDIGFAECVHKKYPQLDEDIVTIIEDLINRECARAKETKLTKKEGSS